MDIVPKNNPVISYVYLLIVIILLATVSTVIYLFWQNEAYKKQDDIMHGYHETSSNLCSLKLEELYRLKFNINDTGQHQHLYIEKKKKVIDLRDKTDGLNRSLYLLDKKLISLKAIQQKYNDTNFSQSISSLGKQLGMFQQNMKGYIQLGYLEDNQIAPLNISISSISNTLKQLRKLHDITHKDLAKTIYAKKQRDTINLRILIAILSMAGALLIARILKLINYSLKEQQQSEEKVISLLNSAPDAIVVTNQAGNIVILNKMAEKITGYTHDEMTGKPIEMLIPENQLNHQEIDRKEYFQRIQTRQMVTGMELQVLRKDGTSVPVEISLSPFNFGTEKYTTSMIRDVTNRKAMEDAIKTVAQTVPKESNAEFIDTLIRQLIKLLKVNIAFVGKLIDGEKVRTLCVYSQGNRIDNFTYPLAGTPCNSLEHRELCFYPYNVADKFPDDKLLVDMNVQSYMGIPLISSNAEPLGLLAILHDGPLEDQAMAKSMLQVFASRIEGEIERSRILYDLDKKTRDLQRSNTDLEQFAYVASHDLQEPLRMVASYVQLLEKRYKDKLDEDANDFINYAVDGATQMRTLINDLLSYSRVSSQGRVFEPADFETILNRVVKNLAVSISEAGAEITHDSLPALKVDAGQITQVFQNLIGNAIKFHGNLPPKVHISAKEDNENWVFAVKDNGIGLDTKYAERIFVIFQRLQGKSKYKGTGIGLAICKKIVERHRGQIWVESVPGNGATFFFTIPKYSTKGDE